MSEELRYSMTAAALEIGRKLSYVGAGTVEFILVKYPHLTFNTALYTFLMVELIVRTQTLKSFTFWKSIPVCK
jgi:acetyl/propionyl-CoA carboxylase alpha subunit